MVFDELWLDPSSCGISPSTDGATASCTSRLVSPPYTQQRVEEDCYTMPIAAPVSFCTSEESDASAAPTKSITGRFRDIEDKYYVDPHVLGTGIHGSVRKCINHTTGQQCAVKTICKNDPAVKAGGLVREITLLQEMKHHNIVQLEDVYEDAEYLHLVTNLCKGGELFDKILEKSSSNNGVPCFSEDEAARVIHQILTAVSYMHKRGVAHRDIKPENILFDTKDEDSPIKIIDFGLARKHYGSLGEPPMKTVVGTPYYIAPEVLRRKYDSSCDLWSVGVIAYILLCGYPPFNGKNNNETHASVLRGRYSFPSREWKGTSQGARDFIRRLLQKDPSKRVTVEQALNHPWIVKYAGASVAMFEEERQGKPTSEEDAVLGLSMPQKGSMLCARIAMDKLVSFGR